MGFLDGFAFETLIAPCDSESFFRDHWNKTPLLEARRLPDFYEGLLWIEDVDRVLAQNARAAADASDRDLDIDAALRRLEQGAALVLEEAQHQIPAMALVCRSVQAELGFRCSMSIQVTMPSNKPHAAEPVMDHAFVLQIAGRRNWRVADSALPGEFVLETGDLLYLPAGWVCQHRSTGDASVTAVLAVKPPSWLDMAGDGALLDDFTAPSPLAEALPPGWLHRTRSEIVSELSRRWRQAEDLHSVEAAVAQLIQTEVRAFPVDLRGRLIETMHPREIREDTIFGCRRDLLWAIEPNHVTTRLIAGSLTIDLQPKLTEAIRFCLSTERYTAADIPGDVPLEDRLALVTSLARNVLVSRISA